MPLRTKAGVIDSRLSARLRVLFKLSASWTNYEDSRPAQGQTLTWMQPEGRARAVLLTQKEPVFRRVAPGLAKRLAARVGKGFGVPNLRNMRQFYLTYREGSALPNSTMGASNRSALPSGSAPTKIRSTVPGESRDTAVFPPYLGWTHYLILMRVANPTARKFYEIEAARESWSSRPWTRRR